MRDYSEYVSSLRGTVLFVGMSDEEIAVVLNAMQPPVVSGPPSRPADGSPHRAFRIVARTDPYRKPCPGRFAYGMQGHGEPGMLMGEILVLSRKEEFMKPTPLEIKPKLPSISWQMEMLELTPEMITRFYGAKVAAAQGKMLRNFLGMLAQKVVDVRRELFLERSGYDIYAPENLLQ
jgi:hypothetical protein